MEVYVRDDLVEIVVRNPEDGDYTVTGFRFYLVAEDVDGSRYAHDYSITVYPSDQASVRARMDRLCDQVRASLAADGVLNMDHWLVIDPAYGSAAYQGLDALGYFKACERAAEGY